MEEGRILLVEDDPNGIELTLAALGTNGITNNIVVVRSRSSRT